MPPTQWERDHDDSVPIRLGRSGRGAAGPTKHAGAARGRPRGRGGGQRGGRPGPMAHRDPAPGGIDGPRGAARAQRVARPPASSSNMIIVDLTAADVRKPGAFARDLLAPARLFERAGQCLLLLGASPELTAALDRYAVPVVTLAADSPPPEAA